MSFKPCTILYGDRLSVLTPLISHVLSQVVELLLLLLPFISHVLSEVHHLASFSLHYIHFNWTKDSKNTYQFRKTSDIHCQHGKGRFNKDTQFKMPNKYMPQNRFPVPSIFMYNVHDVDTATLLSMYIWFT